MIRCGYCKKRVVDKLGVCHYQGHLYCNVSCFNRGTKSKHKYPLFIGNCGGCGKSMYINNSSYAGTVRRKHFCNKHCVMLYRNRYMWTADLRQRMADQCSRLHKGRPKSLETKVKFALANLGSKSHFWLGGKTLPSRGIPNAPAHLKLSK